MLDRELRHLRLFSAPSDIGGARVQVPESSDRLSVWVVRYPQKADIIHAFPNLMISGLHLSFWKNLEGYARWRAEVSFAERALAVAKEKILASLRAYGARSARIAMDPQDPPGRTILLYPRRTREHERRVLPEERLSILTFSDHDVPHPFIPDVPPPAGTRESREGLELLIVSASLYQFLLEQHRLRSQAKSQAEDHYRALLNQKMEALSAIHVARSWASQAVFLVESPEGPRTARLHEALAFELSTGPNPVHPDSIHLAGLAVEFAHLERWALFSVVLVEGKETHVSESEAWSFRFPKQPGAESEG